MLGGFFKFSNKFLENLATEGRNLFNYMDDQTSFVSFFEVVLEKVIIDNFLNGFN